MFPTWPVPDYPTREAALVAALEGLEPGDAVFIHHARCAMARDEDCSCWPQEVTVPEATQ